MIKTIFVVLGLVMFLDALMEKWKIWIWLTRWSMNQKYKFFYLLFQCRFCVMFHLSWIVTVVYVLANEFFRGVLIVPFIVSGLIQLNEKR